MPEPIHPLAEFVDLAVRYAEAPGPTLPARVEDCFVRGSRRHSHLLGLPTGGWWFRERPLGAAIGLWNQRVESLGRALVGIPQTTVHRHAASRTYEDLRRAVADCRIGLSFTSRAARGSRTHATVVIPGISYAITDCEKGIASRLAVIPFGREYLFLAPRLKALQGAIDHLVERGLRAAAAVGTQRVSSFFGTLSALVIVLSGFVATD